MTMLIKKQFKFETKNHKFISFFLSACYHTKESCEHFKLRKAFRNSVKEQIWENKATHYFVGIKCRVLNIDMDWTNTHVDHDYEILPFIKIINEFMSINPDLNYSVSYNQFYKFVDTETTLLFQEYHRSYARIRLISKNANLRAKKSYIPNFYYFYFLL